MPKNQAGAGLIRHPLALGDEERGLKLVIEGPAEDALRDALLFPVTMGVMPLGEAATDAGLRIDTPRMAVFADEILAAADALLNRNDALVAARMSRSRCRGACSYYGEHRCCDQSLTKHVAYPYPFQFVDPFCNCLHD